MIVSKWSGRILRVTVLTVVCAGVTEGATRDPARVAFPSVVKRGTKYCEYRDVRELGAKGDGITDDTHAFEKAVAAKKRPPFEWLTIYVPNGTYLVSDTIAWSCRVTMVGEQRSRTVIKLKDRCRGFGDPKRPKAVVHTAVAGGNYGNDSVANAAFHNYVMNMTIDVGRGNPGAIGVRYTTHNSGILGDVTIRSRDRAGAVGIDMSQTEFGPGMVRDVLVEGFDVGIKSPGNVSSVAMSNITVKNQNVVGFENSFPASVHGFTSHNRVPAVRNGGGQLGLLVLFDAKLDGGAHDAVAIENTASMNLRNVSCSGYRGILRNNGTVLAESRIDDLVVGRTCSGLPSPSRHLNIPPRTPPPVYDEPASEWAIVDSFKKPGDRDDTASMQRAIDSGAKTVCLSWGRDYTISDTVHIRGAVRRIVGAGMGSNITGPKQVFVDRGKPMFRFDGEEAHPVAVQNLSMGIWPHRFTGMEIATRQTVHLDDCSPDHHLRTTPEATGTLFLDEMTYEAELNGRGVVYVRQLNTENNPFDVNRRGQKDRTYIRNNGARLWVLSMKTEAPAIHIHTTNGGETELLGGFFRDHFGPGEYGGQVPFFITEDASISASYVNYAWAPGKARTLQGVEVRDGVRKEALLDCYNMAMYSSYERKPGDVELVSFEASDTLLAKGGTCTLTWEARNARSVVIKPGIGRVAARGSKRITITEPTTFMLQADGQNGPEIGQVEVLMYRRPDATGSTRAGLDCAYYEFSAPPGGLGDLPRLKPRRRRTAPRPDLVRAAREENYALVFTGYLQVPATGVYTLYTTSDDGSAFYVGDTRVVNNDGLHPAVERSGMIALERGKHAVRIPYFQGAGGAALSVSYEGPGVAKRRIPDSAWSHRPR